MAITTTVLVVTPVSYTHLDVYKRQHPDYLTAHLSQPHYLVELLISYNLQRNTTQETGLVQVIFSLQQGMMILLILQAVHNLFWPG